MPTPATTTRSIALLLGPDPGRTLWTSVTIRLDQRRCNRDNRGSATTGEAQGAKHEQLRDELASLDPAMAAWADDFIFGEIWGREGISQDERMLVAITALAATEHPAQLRNYLHVRSRRASRPARSTRRF